MAEGLTFDWKDVEGEGKGEPWTARKNFGEEVDTEDMGDTAAAFAVAAGEASDAGDLATHATEIGSESGNLDGDDLMDSEGRVDETSRQLQGNGQGIDEVVGVLVKSINQALDTSEEIDGIIEGDGFEGENMNDRVTKHVDNALEEWEAWGEALEDAVSLHNSVGSQRGTTLLMVYHGGRSTVADKSGDAILGTVAYSLPDSLKSDIRQRHLSKAADDAGKAEGEIEDAIEHYRKKLTDYGGELGDMGYDVSESPLNLWHTTEMAEYHGEELSRIVNEEDPDPREIYEITRIMGDINDRLYDENGEPRTEDASLTLAERAYLNTFFDHVDSEDLAALGELRAPGVPGDPVNPDLERAQRAVANGMNTLMNPDMGGIDPSSRDAHREIPASISDIMNFEVHDAEDVTRFNGIGAFAEHATVAPGQVFGERLAGVAVDAQKSVQGLNLNMAIEAAGENAPDPLVNTGSSGLLSNVSLNSDVSTDLMKDATTREEMLGLHWADSEGIGKVVTSAITPDEGEKMTRDQMAAADGVVKYFADSPEKLIEDWNPIYQNTYDVHPMDSSHLQQAVAGAALSRLDILADTGNQHYSSAERTGTFALMAGLNPSANEFFKTGVYTYERDLAYEVFTGGAEGGPGTTRHFERIGALDGLVDWGERHAINHYDAQGDSANRLKVNLIKSSIGATIAAGSLYSPATVPLTLAGSVHTVATSDMIYTPQAPQNANVEDMERALDNNMSMRHAVAAAALEAQEDGTLSEEYQPGSGQHTLPDLDATFKDPTGEEVSPDGRLSDIQDDFDYVDPIQSANGRRGAFEQVAPDTDPSKVEEEANTSPN